MANLAMAKVNTASVNAAFAGFVSRPVFSKGIVVSVFPRYAISPGL